MTLREIAAELGVSPMTVYRRLRDNAIQIETLRDGKNGITAEGASIIANLFRSATDDATRRAMSEVLERSPAEGAETVTNTGGEVAGGADRETLERAEHRAELAEVRYGFLLERVQGLEMEIERLRGERDRLLAMLEAEQRQRLLTDGQDGGDGHRRRGLFGWFRR